MGKRRGTVSSTDKTGTAGTTAANGADEAQAARDASAAGEVPGAAPAAKATPEPAAPTLAQRRRDPDAIRRAFETGEYPYQTRVRTRDYEDHMAQLQVELLKRHRAGESDPRIREGIELSVNAIATALRNSG